MTKYVVVATERECLEAAAHIVGQTLSKVAYVGLTYEQPETVRWHFADWHWPEVGVELATSTGDLAYAIWDHEVSQHELTLALGPMSDRWLPLRPDSLVSARRWDVSDSEEWAPMVQNTIDSCEVIPRGCWESAAVCTRRHPAPGRCRHGMDHRGRTNLIDRAAGAAIR